MSMRQGHAVNAGGAPAQADRHDYERFRTTTGPVQPDPSNRIAFVTTCVPGKEPPDMVRATLTAAVSLRSPAPFDVWLLDEGDDPVMRQICAELGVNHFSRKGVHRWNTRKGAFR